MAANEKFNSLIAEIENQVTNQTKSAKDIYFDVSRSQGLQPRDLSTVFSFLTNNTLFEYIKNRKLMAAYDYLIAAEKPNMSKAIGIADYGDQPSFIRAFKKMFMCTPKEAVSRKDYSKLSPSLSWDMLSSDFTSASYDKGTIIMQEKMIFGITEANFAKLSQALDLGAFYGFSTMFSNYAYDLAEKTGRSLEDTFAYVGSLREYGGDFTDDPEDKTPEEALREVGDNPTYQKLFFERRLDVSAVSELMFDYGATEDLLMQCNMEMINLFPGLASDEYMHFPYYIKAYEYYSERLPISVEDYYWYNRYLDELMTDTPIEYAFEDIYPFAKSAYDDEKNLFDYGNYDVDVEERGQESYSVIDALDEEQQSWREKQIDDSYDPDNTGFDYLDRQGPKWFG